MPLPDGEAAGRGLSAAFRERYRLEEPLGIGAMGCVYLSADHRFQRPVAIKFMRGVNTDASLARFEREGKMMARVAHPGVVRVLDAGAEGHHPYLVFQLVDGCSLERLIGKPMSVELMVGFGEQILEALAACHQQGIVHRDLKPSNVMVNREGRALVTDFGISACLDPSVTALTEPGHLVGTPHYMAPEQTEVSQVGPPADVYACGLILYELASGRRPFQASSIAQLMDLHRKADPPALDHLRPDAPEWLCTLVHEMLAKRPEHRPDAATAARRLRAGLPGYSSAPGVVPEPTPGPAPIAAGRPRPTLVDIRPAIKAPTATTSRRGLAIAAVASLALLAAIDAALITRRSKPPEPSPTPTSAAPAPAGLPDQLAAALDELGAEVASATVELAPWGGAHEKTAGRSPLFVAHLAGTASVTLESAGEVTLPSGRKLTPARPRAAIADSGLVEGLNWVQVSAVQPESPPRVKLDRNAPWPAAVTTPAPPAEALAHERLVTRMMSSRDFTPAHLEEMRRLAGSMFAGQPELTATARELVELWHINATTRWDVFYVLGPQEPVVARMGWLAWPPAYLAQAGRTLDTLQTALAMHRDRWELHHELGSTLCATSHVQAGRAALLRALLRWPRAPISWRSLGSPEREQALYRGRGELSSELRARRRIQAQRHYQIAISVTDRGVRPDFAKQLDRERAELSGPR